MGAREIIAKVVETAFLCLHRLPVCF